MTIGQAGSGSVRGEDFNEVVDAIIDGLTLEVTAAEIDSQAAQDGDVLTADGGAAWVAGGGGSQPWQVVKIPFSFNMAGISDIEGPGVASGWTPALGDFAIAQLCSVSTAFDGTNPNVYIGRQGFADGGFNTWANAFAPVLLSTADYPTTPASGWLLTNFSSTMTEGGVCDDAVEQVIYVLNSEDGSDPGNAAGAGILYLLVIPA